MQSYHFFIKIGEDREVNHLYVIGLWVEYLQTIKNISAIIQSSNFYAITCYTTSAKLMPSKQEVVLNISLH